MKKIKQGLSLEIKPIHPEDFETTSSKEGDPLLETMVESIGKVRVKIEGVLRIETAFEVARAVEKIMKKVQ